MFLTNDPSNWSFILSAAIITFIALRMLWRLYFHPRFIFKIERFKAKWEGKSMSWDNFWRDVPYKTELMVIHGRGVGRVNYEFKILYGYETSCDVPLSDYPAKIELGCYYKTLSGKPVKKSVAQ